MNKSGPTTQVHSQVPWLVKLESPVLCAGRLGLDTVQVAHDMAAQASVRARARDAAANEFLGHGRQIIYVEHQGAAQMFYNALLGRGELGMQATRSVRAIFKASALLPPLGGLLDDAMSFCQDRSRLTTNGQLGTYGKGSAGVLVQLNKRCLTLRVD